VKVYWYYRQRNQSPLVTPAYLARQKRLLLPGQYALEHENMLVDGADAFTTRAAVEAAMSSGWTEQHTGRPGVRYEHFVDLGAVHDPTVIGCGHLEHGVVYLDALITFQGSRESPVLFPVVKQAIVDLAARFLPQRIRVESWQGLSLTQELRGLGLPIDIFTPTAKAHADEWPILAQRLSSRMLALFPHDRLREELLNLTYEVGPSGVRVIDKGQIHQDHAVVLRGICAGLTARAVVPFTLTCDGVTIGGDEEPDERPVHAAARPLTDRVKDAGHAILTGLQTVGTDLRSGLSGLVADVKDGVQGRPPLPAPDPEAKWAHGNAVQKMYGKQAEEERRWPPAGAVRLEHVDPEIAEIVRRTGCFFPGDAMVPRDASLAEVLASVRQAFRRWK
jgi:hypothetical protein